MDIEQALIAIKTVPLADDDRAAALDVLRSAGFTRATVRARLRKNQRRNPTRLVDNIATGHHLRDDLAPMLTVYRLSVPAFRCGQFWDSLRWGPSVHLDATMTPQHELWTTTIKRDDPRILAYVNASEFIIERLTHNDVRPAG